MIPFMSGDIVRYIAGHDLYIVETARYNPGWHYWEIKIRRQNTEIKIRRQNTETFIVDSRQLRKVEMITAEEARKNVADFKKTVEERTNKLTVERAKYAAKVWLLTIGTKIDEASKQTKSSCTVDVKPDECNTLYIENLKSELVSSLKNAGFKAFTEECYGDMGFEIQISW